MTDVTPAARALGRVTSGLYIVTTGTEAAATGFLGSWVQQSGFEPPSVTVAVQNDRAVLDVMRTCGHFCVSVLGPASARYLKHFARGFAPGEDAFAGVATGIADSGVPYLADAHAWLACEIAGEASWSDHTVLCGAVVAGACADLDEVPLTHVRRNGLSY